MRDKILIHAVRLAAKQGFEQITRLKVAKSARVSPGSVSYHFQDMKGLRTAVIEEALNTSNLAVLAQGIVARHPIALAAPIGLRLAALSAFTA